MEMLTKRMLVEACGPFIGSLLSPPHKVQRKDRTPVELYIGTNFLEEYRATWRMFFSRKVCLCLSSSQTSHSFMLSAIV